MIRRISENVPGDVPSADGFRTFLEFDWGSIDNNLVHHINKIV